VSIRSIQRGLGAEIRQRRTLRKLSQEGLALRAEVHTNVVGRLERGEYNPSVRTLYLIAEELKVPLSELFAGAEKR
jgi:transcriptional regulator with XRE-family HTH domain